MEQIAKSRGSFDVPSWTLGRLAALAAMLAAIMALTATAARASLGYEPDASPSIALQGELPHGVAIDQVSQRIYVAMVTKSESSLAPGQIDQLESTGASTAASPFTAPGSEVFFTGVAVNPVSQGIYAAQFIASTPIGNKGTSTVDQFSSIGTLGTQFVPSNSPGKGPQIATDSSGNVYYPSDATHTVQVFNSGGILQSTITCGGCPGGAFTSAASVAIDSEDNVYVADLGTGRVVKFTRSGNSYTYSSVLQSGRGAAAVGVDPSDNSVFVGDLAEGEYHIVAYDSSGSQFDDFGSGLIFTPSLGAVGAGQIAVNATTHKLYVSEPNRHVLLVFDKVTIHPPTVTTNQASPVGQVTATLNATVNPNFHAAIACHFEYVADADFQINEYGNATDVPCSSLPGGSSNTPVSADPTGLSPSTEYHYRVVAENNAGSVTGGNSTFTTLPTTPSTVTTEGSSGVSQTVATLSGKVNPHGGSVSNCHFEYGIGFSYATSVSCTTPVKPVTTDVAQSKKVTGLAPLTTYHYRLVVTSNAGLVDGNDQEVTTLPQPPAVTTEPASGITLGGATVAGSINPSGGPASCHFEYGTTTAYGSTGACATDPGNGNSAVVEHLGLTGLAAATTYHYRLVGANAGGTTNGLDLSFTTKPLPPPVVQPPPLQPVAPVIPPEPLKCKKGFRKAKVHGKLKCVKKKRHHKHRHH